MGKKKRIAYKAISAGYSDHYDEIAIQKKKNTIAYKATGSLSPSKEELARREEIAREEKIKKKKSCA